MSSCKTSAFTFQSSVHSLHVLRSLDEQRHKDLFCDVTVVVENRSFRAHRSVLASCSEYFSARVTNHTGQGLIINLPDEVTTEGFEPLLQFAYTSKLLFTKENVLEINNSATVLGFKNLDKACFDFILPKFFDSSKGSSKGQRNRCCKTKCWKAKAESSFNDDCADDTGDVPSPTQPSKKEEPNISSNLSEQAARTCSPCPVETEADPESESKYSSLCPKYRKFQLACGKSQSYSDPEPEITESTCSLNCLPCSSFEKCESADNVSSKTSTGSPKENAGSFCCPLANQSPIQTPSNVCSDKTCPEMCPGTASYSFRLSFPSALPHLPPPPGDGEVDERSSVQVVHKECTGSGFRPGTVCLNSGKEERSSVEMEVANQLSAWPDICSTRVSLPASGQGVAGKSSELQWLKQLECPFLRDLGAVDAEVRCSEVTARSVECSYVSSIHSEEDSDSFDTEGDSESCTSEQASLLLAQMQLPFSLEGIVSLSRNDFQQMLKTQQLTREQLDFVHDVRRRSKNRIAARRCRKRKLDCIHNLEHEIEKLRSEKEKLTAEKRQLGQMRLKTWENYSLLYDRLCSEAKLQPEQLQIFAKYTSLAECPFSSHLSTKAQLCYHSEPDLQLMASCLGTDTGIPEPGAFARSAHSPNHKASDLRSAEPLNTGSSETRSISSDQISKLEIDKS